MLCVGNTYRVPMKGLVWKCSVVALASIIQSYGLALQRMSHIDRQLPRSTPVVSSEMPGEVVDPIAADFSRSVKLWRMGIALFVVANLFGSTVQLTVLPLVLVCTLQATGIVANSLFATLVLHEPLTNRHIVGTILVTIGAVCVAGLGGAKPEPDVPLSTLLELYVRSKFLVWMWFTIVVATILVYIARKRCGRQILSGCLWGIIGGITSAHSLLMAKLAVGLLVRDLAHIPQLFLYLQYWLILLLFLFFAIFQMWCVNTGLQSTSTAVLYPLVFCVYNITTLVNSLMLYGVGVVFDTGSIGWVACGTLVLLSGVLLLSSRFDEQDTDHPLRLDTPPSTPVATSSSQTYTSFDSINPSIANPDKQRGRHSRTPLSREQHKILQELGM